MIIAALILFVTLALRHNPDEFEAAKPSSSSSTSFDNGQYRPQTLTQAPTSASASATGGFWGHTLPGADDATSALGQASSAMAQATGAAGQAISSAQGAVADAMAQYTALPGVGWAMGARA